MDQGDMDYHDALIRSVVIDISARTVSIQLEAYLTVEAAGRTPLEIVFSEVQDINLSADLAKIAENEAAGTVNYCHPLTGPGTTHMYLVDGHISIRAGREPQIMGLGR